MSDDLTKSDGHADEPFCSLGYGDGSEKDRKIEELAAEVERLDLLYVDSERSNVTTAPLVVECRRLRAQAEAQANAIHDYLEGNDDRLQEVLNMPHAHVPAGTKADEGKAQWHLMEMRFVEAMVRILTYGATKYTPGGWKRVEAGRARYFDAMMRHAGQAWAEPASTDEEHGESHWVAVAVNAMILWWLDAREAGK